MTAPAAAAPLCPTCPRPQCWFGSGTKCGTLWPPLWHPVASQFAQVPPLDPLDVFEGRALLESQCSWAKFFDVGPRLPARHRCEEATTTAVNASASHESC